MKTFFVEMITPERLFYKGNIEQLVVETVDGFMGILAGHVPTVTALKNGSIRFYADGKWNEVANSAGFVEIRPDETVVLAQALEWPYEIDANRAREAAERAEEVLRRARSRKEYELSKASLARAFARLRVKSHYHD